MKRSALIISDNLEFREWLGCHVTTRWPKIVLEYSKLSNAPLYLDRAKLERYKLIVVKQDFQSFADLTTCIYLMRILNLESRPEIVLIADHAEQLRTAQTTRLGETHCFLTGELTSEKLQNVLESIVHREIERGEHFEDGAPRIPGYTILQPISGTYSATVYKAFSHALGKEVALKICELGPSKKSFYHRLTLREEFEIYRAVGPEYVAGAYDYGEIHNLSYVALEYLPNGSIGELFASSGRNLSRVDYMLRVAEALRQIHFAGYLHLDIKPSNIMIRGDGTPVFIDFGISKPLNLARTPEGSAFSMGSPHYMSPEQIRGEPLDERSDIYSFGALWYRIFTGRTPFRGRTIEDIKAARDYGAPPSMGFALRHYQPIVDSTVVNELDARFESTQDLINNIKCYSAGATGAFRQLELPGLQVQTV